MEVTQHFRYVDIAGLYAAVGDGHTSAQSVVERLMDVLGVNDDIEDAPPLATHVSNARSRVSDSGVIVHGVGEVLVKLARCCTPVPPDPIAGYVTKGSGVSVHREDCPNLLHLKNEPAKLVEVEWAPRQSGVFLVEIQVEALDRKSLLSDVTRVLAESHVNILAASVNTSRDRVAMSKFAFEMGDPKYLHHVLNAVRRIDGVYDVYRTSGSQRRN
jgi:GTP diphosphokinase / guanosine-3',5'-bis(diphosphate) 3'-diphosphatase